MEKSDLAQMRRTAAEILAAALHDCIPQAFLIRGGETSWGFYYDFTLADSFTKEMLVYIEERMRVIVAANEEIKIHEMIPKNAIEFLQHHKRSYPAHFVQESSQPLVCIFQLGPFIDYVQGSFLKRTGELKAFRLLDVVRRPDLIIKKTVKAVYRIKGIAASSPIDLKNFLRKKKQGLSKTHLDYGEELKFFKVAIARANNYLEEGRVFWEKTGEELLYRFYSFWRSSYLKEDFELVITYEDQISQGHEKLYRLSNRDGIVNPVRYAEYRVPISNEGFDPLTGLLEANNVHHDQSHIFCSKKHLAVELKSSLKFLEKSLKIFMLEYSVLVSYPEEYQELFEELGFKGKVVIRNEARLEWMFNDGYGRCWKGPFLTLKRKENLYTIMLSIFPSLERIIGLILENLEKDLSQKKELFSRIAPID